jgi:putative DNA primase/helicase
VDTLSGDEPERFLLDAYRGVVLWRDGDGYRPIADTDVSDLTCRLDREHGVSVASALVHEAVGLVAHQRGVDPLLAYLDSLKWDRVNRLADTARLALGASAEGDAALVARWVMSAVARAYRPGCQADAVLILSGPQNLGKSSFLRTLFGEEWFSDAPIPIGSPDALLVLASAWCHELPELDSIRRRNANSVKAFLSAREDRGRLPWGRNITIRKRRCILAGTTNEDGFLADATGSRRFWVVPATRIDLDWVRQHRDQLWAETVDRFRAGEPWWLTPDETVWLQTRNVEHEEEDAWAHDVLAWVQRRSSLPRDERHFTVSQVLREAVMMSLDRQDKRAETRVSAILMRVCKPSEQRRIGGVKARWWFPPEAGPAQSPED